MHHFSQQNDRQCNPALNRRWTSPYPSTPAETRLAELRRVHGNITGTRIHRVELAAHKSAWLS